MFTGDGVKFNLLSINSSRAYVHRVFNDWIICCKSTVKLLDQTIDKTFSRTNANIFYYSEMTILCSILIQITGKVFQTLSAWESYLYLVNLSN